MEKRLLSSLIVNVYNQAPQLDLLLESIEWQTNKDFEIIIADDGSSDNTNEIIQKFKNRNTGIPIKHVWHEDLGFRRTIILNDAAKATSTDYLIFVDGDMILHPRFIEMHMRYAHPKRVMCGWRGVKIKAPYAKRLIEKKVSFNSSTRAVLWRGLMGDYLSAFRTTIIHNKLLRKIFAKERGHVGGCNFAMHKDNYWLVNGMDATILRYGYEDIELGHRLQLNGIEPVGIRNCANTYHLEHKKSPNPDVKEIVDCIYQSHYPQCRNGLKDLDEGSSDDMFQPTARSN